MLTGQLAQTYPHLVINSVPPGICTSNVSLGMGIDSDRSGTAREECARNVVRLAHKGAMPHSEQELSGLFWLLDVQTECEFVQMKDDGEKLWEIIQR